MFYMGVDPVFSCLYAVNQMTNTFSGELGGEVLTFTFNVARITILHGFLNRSQGIGYYE